jgi:hypothetical protein
MNQLRTRRTQAQRTPEYLDDFALRAQRAGFTCAFVGADVTVNGKVPDFLCLPPRVADRFHELHPEATRLTLAELETFINDKYGNHDGQDQI